MGGINGEGKILNFRLFSKTHNLYTNSRLWPSNQLTFSDFFIAPDGKVVEAIHCLGQNPNGKIEDFVSLEFHDSKKFHVEPWTGYFDIRGKKIYRGDILGSFNYRDESEASYKAEVVWEEGGFYCKEDDQKSMPLEMDNKVWKRHIILGNIHGVEYSE